MKYYYTDGLKAAWMCKHFKMNLLCNKATMKERAYSAVTLAAYGARKPSKHDTPKRFYISPDCHEMLKPQIGDLMTNLGVQAWWVIRVEGDKVIFANNEYGSAREMIILQRNGKAFFTPEQEAA